MNTYSRIRFPNRYDRQDWRLVTGVVVGVPFFVAFKVKPEIGSSIEIESLERYVLKVENDDQIGKLRLVIEDSINRYDMVFENPKLEKGKDNNYTLYALGEKGMLAKGPDLVSELVKDLSILKIYVTKGRKTIFHDNILLGKNEMNRFEQYLILNFG